MSVISAILRVPADSRRGTTRNSVGNRRLGVLLCVLVAGCSGTCAGQASGDQQATAGDRVIPTNGNLGLVENSAAVITASQPGVIFGLNDSGHSPGLFALDTLGNDAGSWAIRGVRNVDWEALAAGDCVSALPHWVDDPRLVPSGDSTAAERQPCLYIGDVGDNDASRKSLTIYQVPEPPALPPLQDSLLHGKALNFRYAGGLKADVEAMYVARNGDLFLITKRRLVRPDRSVRPTLVFRLPRASWDSTGLATALLVDSLPIVPGTLPGRQVTDAALSHDGSKLAVRTYTEVFIFTVQPASGRLVAGARWWSCPVDWLREKQGEGVSWCRNDSSLVLTSEGRNAPLHVIRCADPSR